VRSRQKLVRGGENTHKQVESTALLTEPFLRCVSGFDNLNDTRAKGLDRWNVVGENAHVTRLRRDVHLHDFLGAENSLSSQYEISRRCSRRQRIVKGVVSSHKRSASLPHFRIYEVRTWWGRTRESLILSETSA